MLKTWGFSKVQKEIISKIKIIIVCTPPLLRQLQIKPHFMGHEIHNFLKNNPFKKLPVPEHKNK